MSTDDSKRRDQILLRMLKTPPAPKHAAGGAKGKPRAAGKSTRPARLPKAK